MKVTSFKTNGSNKKCKKSMKKQQPQEQKLVLYSQGVHVMRTCQGAMQQIQTLWLASQPNLLN